MKLGQFAFLLWNLFLKFSHPIRQYLQHFSPLIRRTSVLHLNALDVHQVGRLVCIYRSIQSLFFALFFTLWEVRHVVIFKRRKCCDFVDMLLWYVVLMFFINLLMVSEVFFQSDFCRRRDAGKVLQLLCQEVSFLQQLVESVSQNGYLFLWMELALKLCVIKVFIVEVQQIRHQ